MRISDWSSDVCSSDLGVAADDWLEEDPAQKRRLRLSLKLGRLFNRDPMAQRAARQQRLAEWRFQRGLAMLAAGELVVTDRLHAHILSPLLDIPPVLLDNSYGKVAGFADQWTDVYGGLLRAQVGTTHGRTSFTNSHP